MKNGVQDRLPQGSGQRALFPRLLGQERRDGPQAAGDQEIEVKQIFRGAGVQGGDHKARVRLLILQAEVGKDLPQRPAFPQEKQPGQRRVLAPRVPWADQTGGGQKRLVRQIVPGVFRAAQGQQLPILPQALRREVIRGTAL